MYFTDLEHQTKFLSHMHMSLLNHNMNTILFMKTTAPTMLTSAVVEKFLIVLLYRRSYAQISPSFVLHLFTFKLLPSKGNFSSKVGTMHIEKPFRAFVNQITGTVIYCTGNGDTIAMLLLISHTTQDRFMDLQGHNLLGEWMGLSTWHPVLPTTRSTAQYCVNSKTSYVSAPI